MPVFRASTRNGNSGNSSSPENDERPPKRASPGCPVGGADPDRGEVVDQRPEPVEDRLAAVDLDAAQAVVVAAHHRVGAVVDGVAGQLELVVLEDLHPARVAPVGGDDDEVGVAAGGGDRFAKALEVVGERHGGDDRIDPRLPEVGVRIAVVGAHPQRGQPRPVRAGLVADRIDGAEAEEGDADAAALEDRRAGGLVDVDAGSRRLDPLRAQHVERVGETFVAAVDHVVVRAAHHVEADFAEELAVRARPAAEMLAARRLAGRVGVDPLAVPEHDVGLGEQRCQCGRMTPGRRGCRGTHRPR